MHQLLLLEDDLLLSQSLRRVLIKSGYQVDWTNELENARDLIEKNDYDLLIADRVIGKQDSIELLEELKADQYFLRVLVVSAKKLLTDRLVSLKLADDFLSKPILMAELLLKIKNLLSRAKTYQEASYCCHEFQLSEAGEVSNYKTGAQAHLPAKEAKILECLLLHRGLAVSYETIFNYVWPGLIDRPQQRTLNVYVRRIRLRLGAVGQKIRTIRHYGFILDNN